MCLLTLKQLLGNSRTDSDVVYFSCNLSTLVESFGKDPNSAIYCNFYNKERVVAYLKNAIDDLTKQSDSKSYGGFVKENIRRRVERMSGILKRIEELHYEREGDTKHTR